MTSIIVNKKLLLKRMKKTVSDKVLSDSFPYIGTTLEKNITDENDFELETYVNRPDYLSEQGLGRGLAGYLGIEKGMYLPKINKANYLATLEKDALKIRPYAVMCVIKNLSFDDEQLISIMQLQEKLHITHGRNRKKVSIGVYDLKNIKFPVTYKAVSSDFKFTPLEEKQIMSIKDILEKTQKGKDFAHLCAGPKYVIWEDSKKQVLSFPPIINSAETALTTSTKDIVIDVTGFDKNSVEKALNIICYHFADLGGEIYAVNIDGKEYPNITPQKKEIELDYCNKLLGLKLKINEMKELFEKARMNCTVTGTKLSIEIPAYRTDVLHPFDLVEEAAIEYGYANFKPEIPQISTIGEESKETILENQIAEICCGMGMLECQTLHLSNENDLVTKMNLKKTDLLRTTNAINFNYNIVRNSILSSLVNVLSENTRYEYPQDLFEIGEIYEGKKEKMQCGMILCNRDASFSKIRSYLEALLKALKINYEIKDTADPRFIEGRCAALILDKKQIGIFGEIHPQILENFKIEMPAAGAEFDLEKFAQ